MKEKNLSFAQIVQSKAGRDAKRFFVIVGFVDQEYVLLVDGDLRKMQRPKKKKIMHIKPTPVVIDSISQDQLILDADIRKALETYKKSLEQDA